MIKESVGEFLGTFILVFIGCSSVAIAVLFGSLNLLEIALIWGAGVALAIFTVRKICPAHLNPAVSVAMVVFGNLAWKKLPVYLVAQLLGAIVAGLAVYGLFEATIINFETTHSISRGTQDSMLTAKMFGEFYHSLELTQWEATLWEGFGTFLLVFVIFSLSHFKKLHSNLPPIIIGLTVSAIICIVAPFTQAGLNPARDFGPRIVAFYSGWKSAAFPLEQFGFFTVYILGPIVGATIATIVHKLILKRIA